MRIGDIIIKRRGLELKYRIIRFQSVGSVKVIWGLRAKYDRKHKTWVTFGKEKALIPDFYRKFTQDDYHYIR